MIRIIDSALYPGSHSWGTIHAIERVTSVRYDLYSLPETVTEQSILSTLDLVYCNSKKDDILLIPWIVTGSRLVDLAVEKVLSRLTVVAAAGNFSTDIDSFSPARLPGIITVGCLNKSVKVAALSNTSTKKILAWAPGTNFHVGPKTYSGTSISAAIYAGLLAESRKINKSIEALLDEYCAEVKKELL